MESLNPELRSRQTDSDAVIVSAFGRGNWMAKELAEKGWQVTLVDVTKKLGPMDPEDAEGPFGLFEASDLMPTQKSRLDDEGEIQSVRQGFTLWLEDGPLEFRSELSAFQLQKKGISSLVQSYVRRQGLSSKESEKERRLLHGQSFRETWLAQFLHQLASPVMAENHLALTQGAALPVFAPFSVRHATSIGWQKGLKAAQSAGVKVRPQSSVLDLRVTGRHVDAIEIEDGRSGVESGKVFIWMLSSAETQRLPKTLSQKLYPKGHIEPDWYWTRFQFELGGALHADQLPLHAVIVQDVHLPWTHANVLVLRSRPSDAKRVDVWARLPNSARYSLAYLEKIKDEILEILRRRLPNSEPSIKLLPPEVRDTLTSSESRWAAPMPVFEKKNLGHLELLKAANLYHCGPEQWASLDWLGQYRPQNAILSRLEKLKAQWDAAASREAAKLEAAKQRENSP
jgi:hypothetical protein